MAYGGVQHMGSRGAWSQSEALQTPGKKRGFFFPWPSQPLAMSCAPVAVPLDTEVPVARGFRRLHARGV